MDATSTLLLELVKKISNLEADKRQLEAKVESLEAELKKQKETTPVEKEAVPEKEAGFPHDLDNKFRDTVDALVLSFLQGLTQ